ncbi:MAG: FIMAH domain-containing protein [Longimicrobiales bacterium]
MLGRNVDTDIEVHPFPDLDYQPWMPWALRNDIALLVRQRTLTAHQAAGLRSKLDAALASLAAGKTTPALNQLKAFNHHVRALIHSGALTEEQGAALIAKVNGTRELVGA